jgi:hypothetical protein
MLVEANISSETLASVHAEVRHNRGENALSAHLLSVFPGPDEAVHPVSCSSSLFSSQGTIPTPPYMMILIRLDGYVIDIDVLRFVTVKNMTLGGVRVHGVVTWHAVSRTVRFVPTTPLEPRSRFKLKLRGDASRTWLGPMHGMVQHCFQTLLA